VDGEVVALPAVAAEFPQGVELFWGFDAFGDGEEVEAAAEGEDGADDLGVAGVLAEAAVELDDVNGEAL
jgi:hypothetical protein